MCSSAFWRCWALFGSLVLWMLFIIQVFVAISDSLFNSSTDGILPDLADGDHLHQANAAKSSTDAVSMILGPVIGGVIFGIGGILPIFVINACSFALSGVFEFMIRYQKTTVSTEKLTSSSFASQIKQTLLFIWNRTNVRFLFLMGMIIYFLFYPLFDVVFPYVVKKTLGFSATLLGVFFAFLMGGVLGGNILTSKLFNTANSGRLMRSGVAFETVLIILVGTMTLPIMRNFFGGTGIRLLSVLCVLLFFIGFFHRLGADTGAGKPSDDGAQQYAQQVLFAAQFLLAGRCSDGRDDLRRSSGLDGIALHHLYGGSRLCGVGIYVPWKDGQGDLPIQG